MKEIDRPKYDNLSEISAYLWRRFLALYEHEFLSFEYNVHVGEGIQPEASMTDKEKAEWKARTQKRMDVLARRYTETWVIEIAERPGLGALGQVQGYAFFADKYLTVQHPIVMALISRYMGFDMGQMFSNHGVLYFVFPGAGPPRLPPTFLPRQPAPPFEVSPP